MRFKGQLLLPGESGPGLKVNLDVAEHHLAVESDGGGLGAWPLEVVDVERLQGDLYGLTVAGEPLRFVADDTIAFAYSAVPAIERVAQRSRGRSGLKSMLGRVFKTPETPDQPKTAQRIPARPTAPVDFPSPLEQAPVLDDTETPARLQVEQNATLGEPVRTEEPIPPASPTPPPIAAAVAPAVAAQCPAVRSDGRRCESQILTDSGFCYPHDPKRTVRDGYEAAQQARSQLKKDATARLNRIYGRLDKAMRQVERGELDPDTAIAMAQLAKTMCAILEMDESTGSEA